jgi:Tfp pilus assembly protein FimT
MQSRQSGFTFLDILVTLSIAGTLSAMAIVQVGGAASAMKADGAMRVVTSQLNTARELAISQRRYMQVRFIAPNQVQTIRTDVNTAGTVIGTTVLSTVAFEAGVTYNKVAGLPDTPDAFGLPSAISFGAATTIQFATDGQLIDQAGNPLNGTLVMTSPNDAMSSRAVTVFGSTGRVRAYRWNGRAWVRT